MKNILDYDTTSISQSSDYSKIKLISSLKEDAMWQVKGIDRINEAISCWLDIDNSAESRNELFHELIQYSMISVHSNKNINLNLFYKAFEPVKDMFSDTHRAFIWKNLSLLTPQENNYNFLVFIHTAKSNNYLPDLEYAQFKISLVNEALKNKRSGFLNLLYLTDKSILTAKHLPVILSNIDLYKALKEKVVNINFPINFSNKVEKILIEGFKQLGTPLNIAARENLYNFLYDKINIYLSQANLGSLLLPLIDNMPKDYQDYINSTGLKDLLLHNKMDYELKSKSDFRRAKI